MSVKYWIQNAALRGIMGGLFLLPYHLRVPLAGVFMSKVVAPMAGYRTRTRDNLRHVLPDLSAAEIEQVVDQAPNNAGRTIMELYSAQKFLSIVRDPKISGSGHALLMQALADGRPVLIVSGHIGNYDAVRGYLAGQGYQVGGLYRPLNNRHMNAHYLSAISQIGTPLFERGRKGLAHLVRHLRGGGPVALLHDQRMQSGIEIDFFGKPALTALSVAEMALKYDALLVPAYGIRLADGLNFEVHFEAPVTHSTPKAMMQALNLSLENQIRNNLGQWLWFHKRWKPRPPPDKNK
ncbi:lauroyl acyltransferase [Amylibacter marinus]|uniref:Lauroyl acyltransferase n=1 Tax=Amylibacter marinus TaxID=1475483 RepID=A0ABQ5VU67_9RHOB|nr:lysophospholipid acyltransferase family protein [Amylibacter marinus]GLQ34684.1 lauroyl acyltransferase [Amylibacter marinus]